MLADAARLRRQAQDLIDENEVLSQAAQRFQHLFQEIPIPTFSYDVSGNIVEWNRAFAVHQNVVGLSRVRPVWELVAMAGEWAHSRQMLDRILNGELIDGVECECRLASGSIAPVLYSAFPLCTTSGVMVGGIGTYIDISDIKRSEQEKADHTNQQLAIMELGQLALSGAPLRSLIDDACRFVHETLHTPYTLVWELVDQGPDLLAAAGYGWPDGFLGGRVCDDSPFESRSADRVILWRSMGANSTASLAMTPLIGSLIERHREAWAQTARQASR